MNSSRDLFKQASCRPGITINRDLSLQPLIPLMPTILRSNVYIMTVVSINSNQLKIVISFKCFSIKYIYYVLTV